MFISPLTSSNWKISKMNGFNGLDDWSESEQEMEEQEEEQEQEEFEEVSESEGDPDQLELENIHIDGDTADYIDECPIDINHFDIIKKLGSGAYGTVFLVRKNRGIDVDAIYALKIISKEEVVKVPKTVVHMRAERKALEILRDCPYIQTLYYAFQTGQKLHLVTEYLPGGEMFTQVQKGPLPEDYVRFYLAELIVALEHIHTQGIVYRDIKLENVLLDADGHVRLVDFGLCKKLGARGRSKSFCGTEEYMAPEVIHGTGHNTAADWWALGVLAIELLSTITPFGISENEENNTIMNRITGDKPTMPTDISREMKDFLTKLLHKDALHRLGGSEPSAAALKQHKLFADIDWEKVYRKELHSPAQPPTVTHPFDVQNFSTDFTDQPPTYAASAEPPNSFGIFRGYSYVAPELQTSEQTEFGTMNNFGDDSTDENLNSLARHILSNRDTNSEFHQKYKFAAHRPLGIGKSSVCMKCFNPFDNNYYAVKIYKRTHQNDNEIDVLQRSSEAKVVGVVHLVEVLTDSKWTYVVMELIDGVNLMEYLSTISLTGAILCMAVNSVLEIVKSIHDLNYTHGRICFKNIYYVRHAKELRLIGFGNAKPITGQQNKQKDYWAIGVLIYTILCGHSPFRSSDPVKKVEKNQFDEKSKEWSKLPQNTKQYIQQLLCGSTSVGTPNALKLVKSIPFKGSKELLEENKKIVEIRACKVETKPVIKTEMTHEFNGIEKIPNGDTSTEIDHSIMSIDASDVHPTPSPTQESHKNSNGPVQNSPSARTTNGSDDKAEPNQYKKKNKEKENKPQPRRLRERNLVNYAQIGRPVTPKASKAVVIKKEDNPPPNDTTKKRGKGRPRKDENAGVQPSKQNKKKPPVEKNPVDRPPTHTQVQQTHAVNRTSAKRPSEEAGLLGIEALSNWVYGWRPIKRLKVSNYCFVRCDYRKN